MITDKGQFSFKADGDSFMYQDQEDRGLKGLFWESKDKKYLLTGSFDELPIQRGICRAGLKYFNRYVIETIKNERLRILAVKI